MSSNEPIPCTYCKSKEHLYVNDPYFINQLYSVICDNCGATGPYGETEIDAWRMWNNPLNADEWMFKEGGEG